MRQETVSAHLLRRRVKNYVFFIRANALRRLEGRGQGHDEPLLTPRGQSALLDAALVSLSLPQQVSTDVALSRLACRVGRMQGHAGNKQVAAQKKRKPLKDRLEKARHRVD